MGLDHRKQIDNLKKFSVDFRVSFISSQLCVFPQLYFSLLNPFIIYSCRLAQIQFLRPR